ncbi:NADPH2:quinone reductase [Prauserella sediminis]|uniref:NADPH2:quinone reductase n=1 Tax=Prauserella sediminis TaxID=577680 RepID=A0A839XKI6_9PSEU|nr:NADPH2:quinone reductase [Prauserella sediminis]
MRFDEQVPHQDGAGVIDALAEDVTAFHEGQRVWLWDVAFGRPTGTAQEYTVVPARHAVPLPAGIDLEHGAALGIPALTAHRALTTGAAPHLGPGMLAGRTILVHGGAGAVSHAAIQLAKWSGATVVTTVSSRAKAELARQAGADLVVDYKNEDVVARVLSVAPGGVDRIVEVDFGANHSVDAAVLAAGGIVGIYSYRTGDSVPVPSPEWLVTNATISFVYTYTTAAPYKDAAIHDVNAALEARALRIGAEHGLPLHRFTLENTAEAHEAVQGNTVGKVLVVVPEGRL